ncbi:MAG: hypothetical protein KDB79_05555 [Acidobacteria bacterium]|nr:hypothetical protein [Acidobacteriota bacterium]
MAKRTSILGSRSKLARYLRVEPMTGSVESIAVGHETNRQSTVKSLLMHMFLMSKLKGLNGALTVGAATSQYFSSTGGNQAAHCIPGQIFHNAVPLQEYPQNNEYLEVTLDCLFGKTDDLDSNFNKADSLAEDKGLRDALLHSCQQVKVTGQFARFQRAEHFYPQLETAFSVYRTDGIAAFDRAISNLRSSLLTSSGADLVSRNQRIDILETYRKTLLTAHDSPETVLGLSGEDVWYEIRN